MFLSQDCVPIVHNIWNKYDYSCDYALSSVLKAISETQQFFHSKAKQVFYASLTKLDKLRRDSGIEIPATSAREKTIFELYKFPSGTSRKSDIGLRKGFN